MDYTLRRQPDGTVNAQPGDAVEVWITPGDDYPQGAWVPGVVVTVDLDRNWDYVVVKDGSGTQWAAPLATVRHARGGAGWHRLREARLREVVEEMADELENWDQGHIKPYGGLISSAIAALADLDTEDADNAETEA